MLGNEPPGSQIVSRNDSTLRGHLVAEVRALDAARLHGTKNAPRLPALRKNPTVALTIDTEVHPPKILLIRGDPDVGEADRLRDDSAERGRGAGPAAG